MNKMTEESLGPLAYAGVGGDSDVNRIMELERQLAAAQERVPGLATTGIYTLAEVDLIEAFRKKPYERLRQTVAAYEETRRILAHTFTMLVDGKRCWCHPSSSPTPDTHSPFCLDAQARTQDLPPPGKLTTKW